MLERMIDRLAHRGPDDKGVVVRGPIGLGHRRLSIIDLSSAGKQPMPDTSGQYWITFNGEIYNFLEIRAELKQDEVVFHSRTDTEIILEAYKRWGVSALERFNGMFAFALWDEPHRRLLLARDRMGKKPLYYYPLPDGGLVFASELKSLCEDPEVVRRINPKGLSHYLSLNYILTSQSILQGVRKLEAAHYLEIEQDRPLHERRYWDLAAHFHQKQNYRSETEASEHLNALLEDSVRLRMISDVPLGGFLSGGVDSSSIVAAMCRQREPQQVYTFSTGFREKTYSELAEARKVGEFLRVFHRDQVIEPNFVEHLPKIVYYSDEPFADTSIIPMYFLAEFARRHVTVALSGDGSDEIFAGYDTYLADVLYQSLVSGSPKWLLRAAEQLFSLFAPVSHDKVSLDYKVRQFLKGSRFEWPKAHYFWRTIFSEDEKKELLHPDLHADVAAEDPYARFRKYLDDVPGCHYLDQAMYIDIKTWLVDDILVKVDRSTMAHSLEARAPFLDYRLVEFAASLPVSLKMKILRRKYLLKQSQKPYLPASVFSRKKAGFNAPISHWLKDSLQPLVENLIHESRNGLDFLNRTLVQNLWKEHQDKVHDNGLKLFSLIVLALWMEQFIHDGG